MHVRQVIKSALGITVFGSSVLRTDPDLATVQLAVARMEQQPNDALQSVQRGVKGVQEALRLIKIPESCVELSQMRMESAVDHKTNRLIGYEGDIRIRVLVRDLSSMEKLLVAVVEAGAYQIDNVVYQSSRLKELRERTRRCAIESARRKADIYAEAAGVKVGAPIHIEDVNPDSLRRGYHSPDLDISTFDEGPEWGEFRPGSIAVTAAVILTYAIFDGA